MGSAFEKLDAATGGALSKFEKDPSEYTRRVSQYKVMLQEILDTKITKGDSPEDVLGKVEDTICEFKKKHSMQCTPDQLKTLRNVVKFKGGYFTSANQGFYFKAEIFKTGIPFDSSKHSFMSAMLNHMKSSDYGVMYEVFRFGDGNRNWGFEYYFIDGKGVRKVVKSTHYFKIVPTDRMAGFSRERYNFTRARKNEMLAGLSEPDEQLLNKEETIFERKIVIKYGQKPNKA